jgi:hypothetical protein
VGHARATVMIRGSPSKLRHEQRQIRTAIWAESLTQAGRDAIGPGQSSPGPGPFHIRSKSAARSKRLRAAAFQPREGSAQSRYIFVCTSHAKVHWSEAEQAAKREVGKRKAALLRTGRLFH